jgi:dTDP-4-dehydrorhamnose 3,5-epimerase
MDAINEEIIVTPLEVIDVVGGDVLHAMKETDLGYDGFGEAYFSTIERGAIKGWKYHKEMTLNLIVPVGAVRFVFYDDRNSSPTFGSYHEVTLSRKNYSRLTVPPMFWMGFQGVGGNSSLLLNIANIPHDSTEVDRKALDEIYFDWEV